MSAAWKTIRVFISSTFRDMNAERDHLVKVVFPALRERLEKHRIHLLDIDLRWGVTREQAENDRVLDLCLQQIDECRPFFVGIVGERYGWVPARYPVDALRNFGWIQHQTGKSVTELEILHGVLQQSEMRGRAFFYFRDPMALHQVPEAIRQAVYADTDPELVRKLKELKRQVRASGYPVMENYSARWDPETYDRPSRSNGRLVGLEAFGERVREQLWRAIREEFQLPEQPVDAPVSAESALDEEQDYHERFMESRLRVYVGRERINDDLIAFADGNDLFPCLVTGPSGSGKSAALARFVSDYKQRRPQTLVVPHFIGASPRSSNLREMLWRFCRILKVRFGFVEEVPDDVANLSVTFREFVGNVPADSRVVFVFDALNQLDEADRAQQLNWLPEELPPHVKVIASCIADSDMKEPVQEALLRREHCPLQLGALTDAEQREIIRQLPSLSAKTLDDEQVRLLLNNPATANPLFLLVALEELRGFASYEQLNERIAALPRDGDTVTSIFTQMIERLEEEFNQKLVETTLTLIASARRGLSERELHELIDGLDGADDLFPVLRQLRPYLLNRAGLIDFYHRNLFESVRERYLASDERRRLAHSRLARYFHDQDYWLESSAEQQRRAKTLPPTPRPANIRKVDELPWQLLRGADWRSSEELLTDLAFLEAKSEAGMVFDLAGDFSAAVGVLATDRPLRRILSLLEEGLRRDLHFISRHPTTLFQCLWNSCWWHDCPEAAKHYELPEGGWPPEGPPWRSSGPKLSSLLQSWRAAKESRGHAALWLRSLRPPRQPLETGVVAVFTIVGGSIRDASFSPGGQRIVAGSDDTSVRVWDISSGAELSCSRGHKAAVNTVAVSPDGHRIVSGSDDTSVRIWDMHSGIELRCCHGHESRVNSVAISPDGQRVASGSDDATIRIWDMHDGRQLRCLRGHDAPVNAVAFDGKRIASGAGKRDREHEKGSDDTIRVWDADEGHELVCLRGHLKCVTSVAFSPDGRCICSGSSDETVRIWSFDGGAPVVRFQCLAPVTNVAFRPDGLQVVSAHQSPNSYGYYSPPVQFYDVPRACQVASLSEQQTVNRIAFSSDGRYLAAVTSGAIRVTYSSLDNRSMACRFPPLAFHLAFSMDGNLLMWRQCVIGVGDFGHRGWDLASWVEDDIAAGRYEEAIAVEEKRSLVEWHLEERFSETLVEHVATGEHVGWFPQALSDIAIHPTSPMWAAIQGDHIFVLGLEGSSVKQAHTLAS